MASAQSIGTVTIDLGLKTAQLEADAGKAARLTDQAMKKISVSAIAAGVAIGNAIGDALEKIPGIITSSLDKMDEFSKAAQKVGVTTEEFSKLAYAAKLSDVSTEDLTTTLAKLSKNQVEAAKGTAAQAQAFSSLGIAVKNADGSLRSPTAVLGDLADLFQALPDGAGKTAIAIQLLGKSGANAIPLLNGGSASLKELGDEAERFGVVIDGPTGRAAELFNDNLTRMQTQIEGVGIQLTAELLPDLLNLEQKLVDVGSTKDTVQGIADVLRFVADSAVLAALGVRAAVTQITAIAKIASILKDPTIASQAIISKIAGVDAPAIVELKGNVAAAKGQMEELSKERDKLFANFGKKDNSSLFKGVTGGTVTSKFEGVTGGVVPGVTTDEALKRQADFIAAQGKAAAATKAQSEADRAARKAQSEAEAQAKRVASATLEMQKSIDDASESLNKTNIPAVDAYNEALVKITEQAAKYTKDGIPTAQVDAFTEKMKALAKATEDASIAQAELTSHGQTLDLAAQVKDAQSASAGVAGLAVANRDYEKSLEALDKQFESLQITPEDYQSQLQSLDVIHKKTIDDLQKQADTAGQFALSAAKGIQGAIADALSGEGVKGGFKGFLDGLADMLRKAAAQIVAADLAKYLFGNYDKTGKVGGLFGSSGDGSLASLFNGYGGTASGSEAASIRNSEAQVTGNGSFLDSAASWLSGLFGGTRAGGGSVGQGRGYIVGEHGPEFFMPSTNGTITPNGQMGGAGRGFMQSNTFLLPGYVDRRTQAQLAQDSGRAAARAVTRNS